MKKMQAIVVIVAMVCPAMGSGSAENYLVNYNSMAQMER